MPGSGKELLELAPVVHSGGRQEDGEGETAAHQHPAHQLKYKQ